MNRIKNIEATVAIAAVAFCCTAAFEWAGAATARAEIVVGVVVPSSGPRASMGRAIQPAAEREVSRINAAGGIDGEVLRLAVEDDDCTTEGGGRAAASLVRQRAVIVLGHPCSNAAIAAAKTYAAAGIWFVAIGAGHPDLTEKRAGPTIFRLGGRDDQQAADTAKAIAANLDGKRIAIVHDRTEYARTLAEGVARGLKAAGKPAVAMEGIVAGKMGYSELAGRLKSLHAGAVYFAGFPAELEILKSDLKAIELGSPGHSTPGLASSGLASSGLASSGFGIPIIASDAAANGSALLPSKQLPLAEGSHLIMARHLSFEATPGQLVSISFEAFKSSALNLTTFNSILGFDTNGDHKAATFVPACIANECR
ncbi:MAG: ABC transporter substrate-binding protein [Hyphomicrobiaceae bacterium]